jgi:hypothetical protein
MGDTIQCNGNECRLTSDCERNLYNSLYVAWRKVEVAASLRKLFRMTTREFAHILLESQQSFYGFVLALRSRRVQSSPFAKHGLFDLLGDDRADLA